MKAIFFCLPAILSTATHAAPPVLSLTQAALHAIDAEIKPDHYDIARADLDADGMEDVIALMNGKSSYVGSGGGTLFIFKGTADGLATLGSVKVVNAPIYLSKRVNSGFRDLVVTVRGGGATLGLASLSFDGKSYPAGAGEATATLTGDEGVLFSEPVAPFEQTESLQGISFKVTSPNLKSANTVTITPAGLEEVNSPITLDVDGTVTLIAFSANRKKSLSQIYLPDLKEDAENVVGYRGRDDFAVVENSLARRFPIFSADAADTKPTGKMHQLQYKLHPGEAGWLLKVEKSTEFGQSGEAKP